MLSVMMTSHVFFFRKAAPNPFVCNTRESSHAQAARANCNFRLSCSSVNRTLTFAPLISLSFLLCPGRLAELRAGGGTRLLRRRTPVSGRSVSRSRPHPRLHLTSRFASLLIDTAPLPRPPVASNRNRRLLVFLVFLPQHISRYSRSHLLLAGSAVLKNDLLCSDSSHQWWRTCVHGSDTRAHACAAGSGNTDARREAASPTRSRCDTVCP